jgi:hypothetical protein
MDNPSYQANDSNIVTREELARQELKKQRRIVIFITIGVVLVMLILISSLLYLLSPTTDPEYVARIRDVFIIIMALESLLVGVVLVILMIQMARLTNLLQNEVKPILESTNETISTFRGTTQFLSDNLTEPIMKINEYSAGLQKLFELLGLVRKKP